MSQDRKKPVFYYPKFVSNVTYKSVDKKRYWLNIEIDKNKTETIVIIFKKP